METNHVRHHCVSDEEKIVGVISVRDLVRFFVDAEGGPLSVLRVLMQTKLATIARERMVLEAAQAMGRSGSVRSLCWMLKTLSAS